MSHVGIKLREFRVKRGWTQQNVADILGMSLANYANIEQGKTKVTTEKLEGIAEKLDTNIFELLTQGETSTFYIGENKVDNNSQSYIIHNSLPENFLHLKSEKEKVDQENRFLHEKVEMLENQIKRLEKMLQVFEDMKS